jgi:hypothetical protein
MLFGEGCINNGIGKQKKLIKVVHVEEIIYIFCKEWVFRSLLTSIIRLRSASNFLPTFQILAPPT